MIGSPWNQTLAVMGRFALLAVTAVPGCEPGTSREVPPLTAVTLPPELAQVLRDYEGAYARRDSSALARLFASDGYLLPFGDAPIRGNEAVAGRLAREGGELLLVPIAFSVSDSLGFVVGMFGAESSASAGGKFVLALRRDASGAWRVAADIANPNR